MYRHLGFGEKGFHCRYGGILSLNKSNVRHCERIPWLHDIFTLKCSMLLSFAIVKYNYNCRPIMAAMHTCSCIVYFHFKTYINNHYMYMQIEINVHYYILSGKRNVASVLFIFHIEIMYQI